jgi:single-stranded-DNA-specific exonuclease
MAAGVTLESARLGEFRDRLNELARSSIAAEALRPALRLDSVASLAELSFETLRLLQRLHPIGQGNPPVQLVAHALRLRGVPKRFGSEERHVRFFVSDGRMAHQAVWWNCPAEFKFPHCFDLAFAPELNEYNGALGIQLKVLDLRESTAVL